MLHRKASPDTDLSEHDYRIGQHRILVGDCLVWLDEIAADSVDVIVTSPPYNVGVRYNSYRDTAPRRDYLAWFGSVAEKLHRVLKPDGSFFLNIGGTNSDPWGPMEIAFQLRDLFVLQNHITWVKSISIGETTHGHFKPVNSKRYLNHTHETLFHFTRSGEVLLDRLAVGVPFQHKSNIARRGHAQDLRCAGNTWFLPYKTIQRKAEKFDHPASFPVELPERCIKLHGGGDLTVLDPFLGTGSTLIACARIGTIGIGIELDPDYASRAAERLVAALNADPAETEADGANTMSAV
ncbi:MAG: site-specific DNA-methyltransferase [Pseudomonadota bacterium]